VHTLVTSYMCKINTRISNNYELLIGHRQANIFLDHPVPQLDIAPFLLTQRNVIQELIDPIQSSLDVHNLHPFRSN